MNWQETANTKELHQNVLAQVKQWQSSSATAARILVLGDVGLDEYLMGSVKRISPEAPVPVLDVQEQDARLGLAANVAQNIVTLGGTPHLLGVVGQDRSAEELKALLTSSGVDPESLIVDPDRPTTRKTRLMSEHHHIARVDFEQRRLISPSVQEQLFKKVESLMESIDGVVIEDYAKGVLSEGLLQKVIALAQSKGKRVLADPHRTTPLSFYRGVTLFKPNKDEAVILSGRSFEDLRENPDVRKDIPGELIEQLQCSHLVITQGKEGMSLYSDQKSLHLPTYARQVFDVTGAGDTVLAALSLGWFSGLSLAESCIMANVAAGQVVSKVGCVPCSQDELREGLEEVLAQGL